VDCGQKIFLGESFYAYEDDDGNIREVCKVCLNNFLEELDEKSHKKAIP